MPWIALHAHVIYTHTDIVNKEMYDRWYMWISLHGNHFFLSWYSWIQNKCFNGGDSSILINAKCNHVSFYSWILFGNFTVCIWRKHMWRVSLKAIYIWTIFIVQNTTEIDQRSPSSVKKYFIHRIRSKHQKQKRLIISTD